MACIFGSLEIIKLLLQKRELNINAKTKEGQNALVWIKIK